MSPGLSDTTLFEHCRDSHNQKPVSPLDISASPIHWSLSPTWSYIHQCMSCTYEEHLHVKRGFYCHMVTFSL